MKRYSLIVALLISGCSIRPVYDNGDYSNRFARVNTISGRDGQIVRAELDRLIRAYPNCLGSYTIDITLERKQRGIAYDAGGIANRLETTYIANISVTDKGKQEFIMHDVSEVSQTYSISGSAGEIVFSLYSDYEKSLLKKLAGKIFERLNMRCRAIQNENRS